VREFGAVADAATKNTEAFRKTIAAAVAKGGGTVLVPAGRWVTGPIHLASNIHLHLAEGAELLFSQDFKDYLPVVFSRWEGLELMNYSPLVYAKDCENVAITGKGKLDGRGQAWWPWKKTQKDAAKRLYDLASAGTPPEKRVFGSEGDLRPSFIQTVGCKNVLIEGVTITSGPMWTIHPVYSENVIVRRVTITTDGPNNDGLNPDSSKNVLVEDSFFSTGDDCVVIKSGLNEDGWRVGRPSENIVVRRLRGERGHGGVVIGSEMSGGVRRIVISNCIFDGTDRGIRIKSTRGRGGAVEDVRVSNVVMRGIKEEALTLNLFYTAAPPEPVSERTPHFRRIHISGVTGDADVAAYFAGLPEAPLEDVRCSDVRLRTRKGFVVKDAKDLVLDGLALDVKEGAPLRLERVDGAEVSRLACAAPATGGAVLELADVRRVFVHGSRALPGTSVFVDVSGASEGVVLAGNELSGVKTKVKTQPGVPAKAVSLREG